MRLGQSGAFIAILAIQVLGCGPAVSDQELGRVVFEVPEIPEGYEPYKLPSLVSPDADQAEVETETE